MVSMAESICSYNKLVCLHVKFLLVFNWIEYQPSQYGDYVYPMWADVIGWLMSFSVVVWIPVYAIYRLCKEHDGTVLNVSSNNVWRLSLCYQSHAVMI